MCACTFEYIFVLVNNRDSVNGGVYISLLFVYTGSVLCKLSVACVPVYLGMFLS